MTKELLLKCIIEKIERDKNKLGIRLSEPDVLGDISIYYEGKKSYAEELIDYLNIVLDFVKDE